MLDSDGYKEIFFENLKKFSVKKLCEIIVTSRYFGSMNDEAILCMQELALRRDAGEIFDYETFIQNQMKLLPDFKINLKQKMQVGSLDLSLLKGK